MRYSSVSNVATTVLVMACAIGISARAALNAQASLSRETAIPIGID